MQQNELANGRMLAYFGTETDRFMHLIDQGKINLRYDIDAQRDNAESNTEIFAQLQRERNDFLQRQSRNNEVIGEDKVSIPRMNANGQFEKDGEVLRENGKELNGRWFLEQQLKQIERTPSGKKLLKTINDDLDKFEPELYKQNMNLHERNIKQFKERGELFKSQSETDGEFQRRSHFFKRDVDQYKICKDIIFRTKESLKPFTITFTNKKALAVAPISGVCNNNINLNLWMNGIGVQKQNASFPEIFHIHNVGKSKSTINEETFVEIGEGLSPFYLPFAHELIHIKHRIDDSNPIIVIGNSIERKRTDIAEDEQKCISLRRTTWNNLEEQSTITDAMDISENLIRAEAREPIRLNYTDAKNYHESLSDILKSANFHRYSASSHNGSTKIVNAIEGLTIRRISRDYYNRENAKYVRFNTLYKIKQTNYGKHGKSTKCGDFFKNQIILSNISSLFPTDKQQKTSGSRQEDNKLHSRAWFKRMFNNNEQNYDNETQDLINILKIKLNKKLYDTPYKTKWNLGSGKFKESPF